ncbi:class I adenylate-forming enzyme family protein [Nordella sp. HKS 07]|uniref:class I adenylate-forming enzyme family protein n=1 Tax=Nordella sp. HKS 07 TaxID=2712222 RepID=UPI0019D0E682|nr:AMP-binding protein [Nordella sp. HKS 07]
MASLPNRISDLLWDWAAWTPRSPALIDSEHFWTYGDLATAVRSAEAFLITLSIRAGDRLMVVNENGRATISLFLAACNLDVWIVLANARLSAAEIAAIAGHCQPRRIIFTVEVSAEAAAHAEIYGAKLHDLPWLGKLAAGPLHEVAEPEPVHASSEEQVAALLYTSGTTGAPKGVMLTHRNLLFNAAIAGGVRGCVCNDVVYGAMPISHVSALASIFLSSLYAGACFVSFPRFAPDQCMREITRGLTVLQGVPAMYSRLLAHIHETGASLGPHRLRFTWAGGSPLTQGVKQAIEKLTGLPLHNGYGTSETSPSIATTRFGEPRSDCAVGPPIPFVEVRIVGNDEQPLGPDEVGEIWCRGPNVMKGYYKASDMTAKAITADGWLRTGDLGKLDTEGTLHLCGRSKELIIRSGFNVYPIDVEAVLMTHPKVQQVAVIGMPAAHGNEEVVAFIQPVKDRSLTQGELAAFCAERLAPYKRPSRYVFCGALPASPTGKILKHRLATIASAQA